MNNGVTRSQRFHQRRDQLPASGSPCSFDPAGWPFNRPIASIRLVYPHARINASITKAMMNPVGRTGRATVDIRVIEMNDFQALTRRPTGRY